MSELFHQLGIDWKLLAAQAVNFLIVLVILRLTVYKPLLGILDVRRKKIKKGLEDAELAKKDLLASEQIKAEKLAEAEKESIVIMRDMEIKTKALEEELIKDAHRKEDDILQDAEARGEEVVSYEKAKFYEEATNFVKLAIAKTVELSPEAIDEKLINQAVVSLTKNKK